MQLMRLVCTSENGRLRLCDDPFPRVNPETLRSNACVAYESFKCNFMYNFTYVFFFFTNKLKPTKLCRNGSSI